MVDEELYLQKHFHRLRPAPDGDSWSDGSSSDARIRDGSSSGSAGADQRGAAALGAELRATRAQLAATQAKLLTAQQELRALRQRPSQRPGDHLTSRALASRALASTARKMSVGDLRAPVAARGVEGGQVAIVGPAAYVEAAGIGGVVAAADLVARPNVKVDAGTGRLVLPAGTSSRTDLVYHSGALEGRVSTRNAKGASYVTGWSALSTLVATAYARAGVATLVLAVSALRAASSRSASHAALHPCYILTSTSSHISLDFFPSVPTLLPNT